MPRWPGGVIRKTPVAPSGGTASGVWSMADVAYYKKLNLWPTLPGAPTGATATAGASSASVAFTAPTNTGTPSTITQYRVTSSPGAITATGASSPINVTGLTNGTSYTFTVAATNAAGTGPESAASNSVTPAPARVTNLGTSANSPNSISPTITLVEEVPAGSLIFIFGTFAGNTGSIGTLSITSSVSQTWNSRIINLYPGIVGQESKMFAAYSYNSAAMPVGATITAQMGATGKTQGLISACVIRDVLTTASVFDASVNNAAINDYSTGSATISGTSSTQSNEVIIYALASNAYFAGATSFTQAAGYDFPPLSTNSGSTGVIIGGGYKVTTGAGQSAAVTNTTNGSNPWGIIVHGFKAT